MLQKVLIPVKVLFYGKTSTFVIPYLFCTNVRGNNDILANPVVCLKFKNQFMFISMADNLFDLFTS